MNRKRIKKKLANFGQRMLRMPRTRGFGVQSPTAYSFLRKVVNEKGFLRNYRQTHAGDFSYPQDAPRQKRLLFRIRTVYQVKNHRSSRFYRESTAETMNFLKESVRAISNARL